MEFFLLYSLKNHHFAWIWKNNRFNLPLALKSIICIDPESESKMEATELRAKEMIKLLMCC